jgi:hypothetical protein
MEGGRPDPLRVDWPGSVSGLALASYVDRVREVVQVRVVGVEEREQRVPAHPAMPVLDLTEEGVFDADLGCGLLLRQLRAVAQRAECAAKRNVVLC